MALRSEPAGIQRGASTGRLYHGFMKGDVILPRRTGGFLSFRFWNDHPNDRDQVINRLHITAGDMKEVIEQATGKGDRNEFYQEFMNQWGPAGGKSVRIAIPKDVRRVHFGYAGSHTGIELSDFHFE